jgi:glutamine phosphoribosylpyrophosphate amidotransferase
MCGIVGLVDFEQNPIEPGLLLGMSAAIAHRGSDDEGYVLISERGAGGHRAFAGDSSPPAVRHALGTIGGASPSDAHIGLGHRRFSVFDLSDAGHQPLFDSERCCCVVFNGEIYNFPPFVDTQHPALVRNDWPLLSFLLWYELFFNENEQRLLESQEIASNGVSRRKYQPGYLRSRMTE